MVFSKEDKILIKNLRQLKGFSTTRFLREFKIKNWSRGGLDRLLSKIDRTGSVVPALPVLLATSSLSKKWR